MNKNVASQKVTFLVIDTSTNTPKTGDSANLTAYVSKDDGAVTVLTDTSATELDATNAPGLYSFDLTQGETNADKLLFSGKSSTSGIKVVPLLVYTRPASFSSITIANGCVDADLERVAGNAVTAASGIPEVKVASIANNAITASAIQNDAITAAKIATDAIDSDAIAASAVTEIQSGLATAVALDVVDDFLDTEIAAIKAKTDNLPADPADASDIAGSFATVNTKLDTIDDFLDTEIADILTDTSTTLDDYVDDLENRLTAALATALQAHAEGIGRVVVGVGSTTTAVVLSTVNGGAPSATNDFYNGRSIVFTSGALTLQATSISDYDGASTTLTVPALTGAPANGVTAIIV